MKKKLKNPAVWSFLYFVNEFPVGQIFPEILNLCEVRKFRDGPAQVLKMGPSKEKNSLIS